MRWHRRHLAPLLHLAGWRGHRLEPGHQPELRPRVDVSACESGRTKREYRHDLRQWRIRSGSLARRQQRLPRPSPRHALLLIAFRSVETNEPRSESSGVFCLELVWRPDPAARPGAVSCQHGSPSASRAGPQSRQFPPYAGRAIKDKDGSLLAVVESTSKIPLNAKKRFREAVNKEPRRE